jgi:hypothetical protein
MSTGEPRKRPGRPPTLDLRGMKFGNLTVLESTELGWRCQCDCGNARIFKSADLKWNGRRSCGCGMGRARQREHTLIGGGLVVGPVLRSIVPKAIADLFRGKYRRRMDGECPICGHVPARRMTMLYGMRSPRFREACPDPRNYMVVCELCHDHFTVTYGGTPDKQGTPANWALMVLGDNRSRPVNKALLKPHMELFRTMEPRMEDGAYGLSDLKALSLADDVLAVKEQHDE